MKGDILIVDHQPNSLNLLNNLLISHGYEVRTATTGSRALRMTAELRRNLFCSTSTCRGRAAWRSADA